ncbi:hypothetical protein [Staphylococcus aureus]
MKLEKLQEKLPRKIIRTEYKKKLDQTRVKR